MKFPSDSKYSHCGIDIKLCDAEYFATIPLKDQLVNCLTKNTNEIFEFLSDIKSGDHVGVSDVYDGENFQNINNMLPSENIILSLTLNSDGIQMFKNGASSVWPLQIALNFLPPSKRYLTKNILVVGAYFGKKVMFSEYLKPLVEELNAMKDGFIVNFGELSAKFVPILTHVVADLPAKAKMQGFFQHNAKQSCGYCLQLGEYAFGTTRYFFKDQPARLRTHEETSLNMIRNRMVDGIREQSPLASLSLFNIIDGFAIDDLHGIYEGVFKKILKLFYQSGIKEPYHLPKVKQEAIDKRILHMKPTGDVTRKPRSLVENLNYLKANELRSLLLFYFPLAIEGIHARKYVDHLILLSSVIFNLSKKTVLPEDISDSEQKIEIFLKEFENLYGRENVTANTHLIRHIPTAVRKLGPLWTQSSFSFETNNGVLMKSVKGTKSVVPQILDKYILRQSDKSAITRENNNIELLGAVRTIPLSASLQSLLFRETLKINMRISLNNVIFTSNRYKIIRSIDYFVEFDDSEIGEANFYFCERKEVLICATTYKILNRKNHYTQIEKSEIKIIRSARTIKRKLVYLEINTAFLKKCFVTYVPNHYEMC